MQQSYSANFIGVCNASLQRKNKPGTNCTWISYLSVDNQKQLPPHIYQMDSVPQGWKSVKPYLFNQSEPQKWLNFPGLILSQIPHPLWKTNLTPNHLGWISSQIHHAISKTYQMQNLTQNQTIQIVNEKRMKRQLYKRKMRKYPGTISFWANKVYWI